MSLIADAKLVAQDSPTSSIEIDLIIVSRHFLDAQGKITKRPAKAVKIVEEYAPIDRQVWKYVKRIVSAKDGSVISQELIF